MPKTYVLTAEKKAAYSMLFVLDAMVNAGLSYSALLEKDDRPLEPILDGLVEKGWCDLVHDRYQVTASGRDALRLFMKRYSEFLSTLDVYHSVDLSRGEFAMAQYHSLDPDAYEALLGDDRWEDLRIAVAEYKKIDPVEIVFMSFLGEGRFDTEKKGWQFDLALGTTWDDLREVCDTALQAEDLGYRTADGREVSGEAVLRDVITKGVDVMLALIQWERDHPEPPEEPEDPEAITVTTVTETTYYDPYYDPYYVSPVWGRWYW